MKLSRKTKLLALAFALIFAVGMTACGSDGGDGGGSGDAAGSSGADDEGAATTVEVEVAGTEFTSGNLTVTVPEGWEVAEDDNDWEGGEGIKLLETANKSDDNVGFVHGEVYVDIDVSDYSDITSTYNEDASKEYAEEYGDDNALPVVWTFNDNTYMGFRQYGYVGDSAEDWSYSAYVSDGSLIEIRAFNDADYANDENREAIQMILASLTIGGEPVSAEQ